MAHTLIDGRPLIENQDVAAMRPSEAIAVISERRRGRGARTNATGRFERDVTEQLDDGWETLGQLERLQTVITEERAKTIIARNDSPDLSFDRSINPYRGCEHGCIYCYARPTHSYLGLSPGLDFETRIFAKTNAAECLEHELAAPGYRPAPLALGAVTDPYQPAERTSEITRGVLEVLERTQHPVGIVTKSHLVTRDIDILARMAGKGLAKVAISVTTLDARTARKMEPRAATPKLRLKAIQALADAGIPTTVMVAPIVPGLTDHEIEAILKAARERGAVSAGYVLLRLPLELKTLFREWLADEFPERAKRVIHLTQDIHGGQDYRSEFGLRQRGSGPFADLIARRFHAAVARLGFEAARPRLRTDRFVPPIDRNGQLSLL